MRDFYFLWTSILLENYYVQAKNVYFQRLDKNVTGDKSTVDEIMIAHNNSIFVQESKTYEIAQRSSKNVFNKTEDASRFGKYEPKSDRPPENVFNDALYDISNITVPNFDEYEPYDISNITVPNFDDYEPESTQEPLEDIFKRYDDINKKYNMYKNIEEMLKNIPKIPDISKIDPKIMRGEIPYDDYKPRLNSYYSSIHARKTMKKWLSAIGFSIFIIAGIFAASRKCLNHRSNVAEDSTEAVSTAFIVVIPKSGKDPKSTDSQI